MNISSRQMLKAITHYQNTNGVNARQEKTTMEDFIEAMRTGKDNASVILETIEGLGKGFHVKGHGSYFPSTDSFHVIFVQSVG